MFASSYFPSCLAVFCVSALGEFGMLIRERESFVMVMVARYSTGATVDLSRCAPVVPKVRGPEAAAASPGTWWKYEFSASVSDLLNQIPWGVAQRSVFS